MPTLITTPSSSATFNVYYEAENRQKRIEWVSGTATVNDLYTALQELFDDLTQLDDGTPLSAQTPTEYTIGIIDTGDDDPWFIDRVTVEYLTGGALTTANWTRVQDSNTGIVRVTCNNTSIVSGDIGLNITHADLDAGTLLDVKGTGAGSVLWIRPDSDEAANNWDSTSGTITCNAHTAVQSAAKETGESLWANIFTLGTIETNSHMYVEQITASTTLLTKYKDNTVDWWSDGHIDILVSVKEVSTEVDVGYIKVFARQHSKSYAFFEVDLTNGGRNPIPLQTGDDLDNIVGYRQMILAVSSADFTVGEIIQDDSDETIQGIVTSNTGTAPDLTVQYYLIGDPLTDFGSGTGGFTGQTSSSTGTAVAPSDVNAATNPLTMTLTHANTAQDIDENDTNENYSILVDCKTNTLQVVQEWLKYVTRRGSGADGFTDAQEGQFYAGSDYRLSYDALTLTVSEGDVVTQLDSGASGTVVAHHTTDKILILRNSRGTFVDDGAAGDKAVQVVGDTGNYVTMTDGSSTAATITPIASSPFGTFAGGTFFGAPGVVLVNVNSADATNYQLIDDGGTVVVPPNKVSVSVANTRDEDRIAVFRLTGSGGNINKAEYDVSTGALGASIVVVGSSINPSVPGKTDGGVLRIVDASEELEYRIRYASWSGTTFTLDSLTSLTLDTGTNTTTVQTTGSGLTDTLVGDLIYNVTQDAYSYVTVKTDNDNVTISPAIASQTSADNIDTNVLPVLLTASDDLYVPILDIYETIGTDGSTGTAAATVTYSSDISVRVVARNSNSTASSTTPMLPYAADATIVSTGLTNNIIRSLDSIKA